MTAPISGAELEALLLGLLRLWQVHAEVSVDRFGTTLSARIEAAFVVPLSVTCQQAPFGIVWQVQEEGGRRRTYPSVIGLIRHLRASLAPERSAARVLFATAERAG